MIRPREQFISNIKCNFVLTLSSVAGRAFFQKVMVFSITLRNKQPKAYQIILKDLNLWWKILGETFGTNKLNIKLCRFLMTSFRIFNW